MADKNVSVLTSGSYTGSQTVREFEVTDLKVEDGKLNGTAVGSVEKEGTGVVDKVSLSFTDVPFEGVGGGGGDSDIVYITVEAEPSPEMGEPYTVTSVDKTRDEITNAVMSNKTLIGRVVSSEYEDPKHGDSSNYSINTDLLLFGTKLQVYEEDSEQHIGWYIDADRMGLLAIPGAKAAIKNVHISWSDADELPVVIMKLVTLPTDESEDFD